MKDYCIIKNFKTFFLLSGQFFINSTEGDEDNEVFPRCCTMLPAPNPSTQEEGRHVGSPRPATGYTETLSQK